MEILFSGKKEKFVLHRNFDSNFLIPVATYLQSKIQNNTWDDYNEISDAIRFLDTFKKGSKIWFDTHVLYLNNSITGVLFIIGGELNGLENWSKIDNEPQSLVLKYFHIITKGFGYGNYWMNSVIAPF